MRARVAKKLRRDRFGRPSAAPSKPPMENPLLPSPSPSPSPERLPAFESIRPEHAEPAIDAVLAESRARLEGLLAEAAQAGWDPRWETLIGPIEEMSDRVSRVWGPVSH